MKKILITGANSYIGTSFEKWLSRMPGRYCVDTLDLRREEWREKNFRGYDTVFHVAGIAHSSPLPSERPLYYRVNRDLAVEAAAKAKREGVGHFIFMSSMLVYGSGERPGREVVITRETEPSPSDFYGDSKLQADLAVQAMRGRSFAVAVMRPPLVYGPGCRGNFMKLLRVAVRAAVFPDIDNRRSMIYTDNFSEFVRLAVDGRWDGVFFPQDREYVSTKETVAAYRRLAGKKTRLLWTPAAVQRVLSLSPAFRKVFGSRIYSFREEAEYHTASFSEGLKRIYDHERSLGRV